MANKLKKLHLTSVDLVRAGANQEADICLYKSANPPEASELPTERESNILKRFINWLKENPTEAQNEPDNTIEKDYKTFNSLSANCENRDLLWKYNNYLCESIDSILSDNDLSSAEKLDMMKKSLSQHNEAMTGLFESLCEITVKTEPNRYDVIEEVKKNEISKANPWHGKDGRFTSGPGGAPGGVAHRTMTQGGISYHVKSGKEPKSGYMCAVYTDRSQWLKGEDVTNPEKRTAAIKSFMDKNKDVLSDPDNYLGTWFDSSTGNISLDISRNFSNKDKAIKYASEHNEKAIWDVKNMTEISTGGTGNNI